MYIYIHVPVVKYINNLEIYNYVEVISTSVHVYIYTSSECSVIKTWQICQMLQMLRVFTFMLHVTTSYKTAALFICNLHLLSVFCNMTVCL